MEIKINLAFQTKLKLTLSRNIFLLHELDEVPFSAVL